LARAGKLTRIIGREKEIEQVLLVMSCWMRRNPLLVGETGVGKRALVEGLAQRAVENNWPEVLRDRRIVVVNLARAALQTLERGKFEEALRAMFGEIRRAKNIVLFLEDFSAWVHANASLGGVHLIALLSSLLADGEAQCLGATTPRAYRTSGEEESLLACHFQPVFVQPPSREDTQEILRLRLRSYESHHRVKIREDALDAAIELSENLPGLALPGKAIQLLDQACALVRLTKASRPPETKELEQHIDQLNLEKENAVAKADFQKAAELRDQADRLQKRLHALVQDWQNSVPESFGAVDRTTIAEVVEKMGRQ
jgi:ATP-dependent Clp protease ATP-binding subunit ClpC